MEVVMYVYPWYHWIAFFYIYCFFGWVFESAYVSLKTGGFVNRGFLRLPMLPLYGTGAVMMLWVSFPVRDYWMLVYASGVVAATALEYATGYVMERLFKMKYWDYSNQRFHLNGYICLSSSIAWGFLTILLTKVIHGPIADFVLAMEPSVEFPLLIMVSIVFSADAVRSTKEALALGHVLEAMTQMKGQLDELHRQLSLLRTEASQKLDDIRSDARLQAAELKADAHVRMEEFKADAMLRVKALKDETSSLASGLRDSARQKIRQQAAKWNEEAAAQISPAEQEAQSQIAERIRLLSQHAEKLREARRKLTSQMSFYRRGLLMGNPTASSKQLAEALEELRDMLKNKG